MIEALIWFVFLVITAGSIRFGWAVGTWLAGRAYGDDRCPRCGEELGTSPATKSSD
jgi:hypothetical protein